LLGEELPESFCPSPPPSFKVQGQLTILLIGMQLGISIHPETPDEILAVSNSERRLNLLIPLTGFNRKVLVLARK
jgi:hypothetical protein